MSKLTNKQRIKQEEAYARDMREIQAMDLASAEAEILDEIEADNKAKRTHGGIFQDAYGGPLVVPDESTKALAQARIAA
jgi:hypothetical protein